MTGRFVLVEMKRFSGNKMKALNIISSLQAMLKLCQLTFIICFIYIFIRREDDDCDEFCFILGEYKGYVLMNKNNCMLCSGYVLNPEHTNVNFKLKFLKTKQVIIK
jgi:hypothetical protein